MRDGRLGGSSATDCKAGWRACAANGVFQNGSPSARSAGKLRRSIFRLVIEPLGNNVITFERLMQDRSPFRRGLRAIIKRSGLGSYRFRLSVGAVDRPQYAYLVYNAANLAAKLGLPRVSVIEFGVAGGNGLLSMERHAEEVERIIPSVKIEIYGFDTGKGLPAPEDYRDLPFHWQEGFFAMDPAELQSKLKRSKLVFGDIADTMSSFTEVHNPAPVGAIAVDVDLYSSTRSAFKLFLEQDEFLLPRIVGYYDDVVGNNVELMSDFTGERLAISEFNDNNESRKISPAHHLRILDGGEAWKHQIWVTHLFHHKNYNDFVSNKNQQLPMRYSQG